MGELSRLDRWIAEMEKQEERKAEKREQILKEYFDEKNLLKLKQKPLTSLTWEEGHMLNELHQDTSSNIIRKQDESDGKLDEVSEPNSKLLRAKALSVYDCPGFL